MFDERQHRDRLVAVGLDQRFAAAFLAGAPFRLRRCRLALRRQHELVEGEVAERQRQHHHDHAVELLAGLRRDRLGAIDLLLALQALRRELEDPGEDQRGDEADREQR